MPFAWFVDRIELSRGATGHNYQAMEGLRGFAVFLVFLVHYATLVEPHLRQETALVTTFAAIHTIGNRGVDLFFVLSGYLIYGSLMHRPQPFGPFMLRRIERIYPAFLVVLGIYLGLSYLVPSGRIVQGDDLAAVLYVAENVLLLPGLFPIEPIVTVAWSLSYEMFYYLAVPFLIACFALRTRSRRWRVALFVVIAAAICGYCLLHAGPVRLVMFIAGILLWEALRNTELQPLNGAAIASLVVAAFAATLIPTWGSAGYTLKTLALGGAFFALTHACLSKKTGTVAHLFGFTPLRWLGNMSYSYYLLHGLALKAAFVALAWSLQGQPLGWLATWALMPMMFAITLIPTIGLYLAIEYPLSLSPHRWLRAPNAVENTSPQSS